MNKKGGGSDLPSSNFALRPISGRNLAGEKMSLKNAIKNAMNF